MDGYEDAVVELWLAKSRVGQLNYDDFTLYFAGNLTRPMPDSPWPGATAQALGPFAAMANQQLGVDLIYNGKTLAYSLDDIARRAYTVSGLVEVVGGEDIIVEKAELAQEVTLMEAARTLCNPVGYRMSDMRGLRRVFFPEPQPGATGKSRAYFGPEHYAPGDLKITDQHSSSYSKVVVFRRSEWGVYEVIEEAKVEPSKVPRPNGTLWTKRIFYIEDFPGDAEQAKDAAHKQAQKLGMGEYEFDITVNYDPDLYRFDQITCARERERRDGVWLETFDFITEGGCSINLSDDTMTFSGFGLMSEEEWIRPVKIVVQRASPSVLVAPFDYPLNPHDSILLGDTISVNGSRIIGISDTLTVADARTVQTNIAPIMRTVPDSIAVADTASKTGQSLTFTVSGSSDDIHYGYQSNSYPPTSSDTATSSTTLTYIQIDRHFSVGVYTARQGLMRFNTASIPDSATVTSATLRIVLYDSSASVNTNNLALRAEWYSWDGVLNVSRDWSNATGTTALSDIDLDVFAGSGGQVFDFELANVSNVNKTGFSGIRLGLSQRPGDAAPTGFNRVRFASWDNTNYAAPQLIVTYSL
jgi:hypothetical protein